MSGSAPGEAEAPRAMRHRWLAQAAAAAIAASAVSVSMASVAQAAPLAGQQTQIHRPIRVVHHRHFVSFNQRAAAYAKTLEGIPYMWGGTTPAGFDCSGLTQYVYRHLGRHIQRTANDQFLEFRPISHARAWPGDLVFFHVSSDPNSYVYHVGIYEGGNYMVAETDSGSDAQGQSFTWAGDTVTFGTITH
jgi:cell wall-associated NlpC family hydrolase